MKIESIIQRPNGTRVLLDRTEYFFMPIAGAGSPHVATVEDEDHIAKFLSIPEGYRLYNIGGKPKLTTTAARPAQVLDPAPRGTILSPIELSEETEADNAAAAAALREEGIRQTAADAAEAAANLDRMNNADLADQTPGPDSDDAAEDEGGEGEADDEGDAEGDEGEGDGAVTEESLKALSRDELVQVYDDVVGRKPAATMKDANVIKAILLNLSA